LPDGSVGVRNHVAALPVSVTASSLAERIVTDTGDGVVATPHGMGSNQPAPARAQTRRACRGVGRNPNVGAALVVALGTAAIDVDDVAAAVADAVLVMAPKTRPRRRRRDGTPSPPRRRRPEAMGADAADLSALVGRVVGGERTCTERHGLTASAISRAGPSM